MESGSLEAVDWKIQLAKEIFTLSRKMPFITKLPTVCVDVFADEYLNPLKAYITSASVAISTIVMVAYSTSYCFQSLDIYFQVLLDEIKKVLRRSQSRNLSIYITIYAKYSEYMAIDSNDIIYKLILAKVIDSKDKDSIKDVIYATFQQYPAVSLYCRCMANFGDIIAIERLKTSVLSVLSLDAEKTDSIDDTEMRKSGWHDVLLYPQFVIGSELMSLPELAVSIGVRATNITELATEYCVTILDRESMPIDYMYQKIMHDPSSKGCGISTDILQRYQVLRKYRPTNRIPGTFSIKTYGKLTKRLFLEHIDDKYRRLIPLCNMRNMDTDKSDKSDKFIDAYIFGTFHPRVDGYTRVQDVILKSRKSVPIDIDIIGKIAIESLDVSGLKSSIKIRLTELFESKFDELMSSIDSDDDIDIDKIHRAFEASVLNPDSVLALRQCLYADFIKLFGDNVILLPAFIADYNKLHGYFWRYITDKILEREKITTLRVQDVIAKCKAQFVEILSDTVNHVIIPEFNPFELALKYRALLTNMYAYV